MSRNAYFDNAKFILIMLVVFGHVIQPFIHDQAYVNTLYTWMYTFHMPVFIFLAGFFAKGSGDKKYLLNLAKKLVIPYLIFQTLYTVYYFSIDKSGWMTEGMFYPQWSLWFLISLFCWHVLLAWSKKVRPSYSIPIAIAVGVLIGYFDQVGAAFSLSRTFVFFPYFLIGYTVSEAQVMKLKRRYVQGISLVVLVGVGFAIARMPEIPVDWLLQSKSYSALGVEVFGAFGRLGVYTLALLMGMAVLACIPRRRFAFTPLGERTLYVYLLHGFIVQYFRVFDWFHVDSLLDVLGLALLSLGIVLLLSTNVVMTVWQPLVELSASLYRRKLITKRKEIRDVS